MYATQRFRKQRIGTGLSRETNLGQRATQTRHEGDFQSGRIAVRTDQVLSLSERRDSLEPHP